MYLDSVFNQAQSYLKESPDALMYLKERGVSFEQANAFGIGYIPSDKWPPYINEKSATENEKFYLTKTKKGFKLRGKLLFPLTNALGMVKGFQTRSPSTTEKDYWKYHDPSADEDAIFFGTKSAMTKIWETETVVLVEGIFDLFPVANVFQNSLCLVTSSLTPNQEVFLKRYVKNILVMTDNDSQGDSFYKNLISSHAKDFDIRRIEYSGKDPSDAFLRLGKERFGGMLKHYSILT